ncbi:hypothetical protein ACQUWM_07780 [Marinobacter sp. DUT-3]|uniref:hypothetical protein n=1 Tax=Marinobacter sp. DUT-3 TaxID=3412036 RepID=UPI003D178C87
MKRRFDVSAIVTIIKNFDYEMLDAFVWDELKEVDPSNEGQMLEVFKRFIVPEYEVLDDMSKSLIKSRLFDLLSDPKSDYQVILDAVEMPFEPVEEPRNFFSLLWFALYGERFY